MRVFAILGLLLFISCINNQNKLNPPKCYSANERLNDIFDSIADDPYTTNIDYNFLYQSYPNYFQIKCDTVLNASDGYDSVYTFKGKHAEFSIFKIKGQQILFHALINGLRGIELKKGIKIGMSKSDISKIFKNVEIKSDTLTIYGKENALYYLDIFFKNDKIIGNQFQACID